MSQLANIKAAIKANLDELVTDTVLAGASESDIRKEPLNADVGSYPHAFVHPPAIDSEVLSNREIIRTYTFAIMVLFKAENLTSTAELENAVEAILDKFDNDPTLQGTALGGVLPVSSSPVPLQHPASGADLIMVVIELEAKAHVDLSFA